MTIEEVIIQLKDLMEDRKAFINKYDPYSVYEKDFEALKYAVDLLQTLPGKSRDIPKAPIKSKIEGVRFTSSYLCPNCGGGFSGTGIAKYCYHCGQRLEWKEVLPDE